MTTSNNKIKFHFIRNPLQSDIRETWEVDYVEGKSLSEYVGNLIVLRGTKLVAAIDGIVIEGLWDDVYPKAGSIVAISAEVEWGIAGAVAAWAASLTTTATVTGFTSALAAGALTAAVYGATYIVTSLVIGMGMNMLANALGGQDAPSGIDGGEDSPTYSWGMLQPSENEGSPIPIIFGTHKIAGHIINKFTTTNDNKEYLNVLLAVADHEVEGISDIRINDQPFNNFKKVSAYTRMGTTTDEPIDEFSEVVLQRAPGILLSNGEAAVLETEGNTVDKLVVVLKAPYGMYELTDSGDKISVSASFEISYRVNGESSWTIFTEKTLESDQTTAIMESVTIDGLSPEKYDVRVMRTSEDHTDDYKKESRVHWEGFKEIVDEKLSYPGVAKYAIKALATDQLSGGMPSLTCVVQRNNVTVEDKNGNGILVDTRNPAWAAYALLNVHHKINYSRLLYDEFVEWATYCESLEPEGEQSKFSIVLDKQSTVWESVQRIASFGRGVIVRRGSKYGVFIDKPEDNVSHVFTMGNIVRDTFQLQYLPKKDRANAVEVTYLDPDKDYTNQIAFVYSEEYQRSEEIPKKTNIKFNACISYDRAVREAIYLLNSNKYLIRTIEFEAAVDSFACVVGDLIYFQHEVPNYQDSISGRILEATSNSVKIDHPFDFKFGVTYNLLLRLSDDTIVEKTVSSDTQGNTDEVQLTSSFSEIPEPYDVFIIGETGTVKKPYRITNITRSQDQTRRITCIEYNENIYDTEGGPGYWEPELPGEQEATGVTVSEFLTYAKSGDYQSKLSVSWYPMNDNLGSQWDIWIEDITTEEDLEDTGFSSSGETGSGSIQKCGTTTQLSFIIGSDYLDLYHVYRIYVSPYDKGAIDTGSNTDTIQVLGKLAPPNDVSVFQATYNEEYRTISFAWSQVSNLDLSHYEIRTGADWESGVVVIENATGSGDSIDVSDEMEGEYTYWIKAVNTSGIKSENAISSSVIVEPSSETDLPVPTGLSLETWTEVVDGDVVCIIKAVWDSNAESHPNFQQYEIYLEKGANGPFSQRSNYFTDESNYQWNGVEVGTEYGVTVRAIDINNIPTNFSEYVTIVGAENSEPPPAPSWDALALVPGFKVMGIKWEKSEMSDVDRYELQRSGTGDFSGEETTVGTFYAHHTVDTDLEADKEYFYRIRAINTSGLKSDWSSIESATTLAVGTEDIAYNAVRAKHIDVDYLSAINSEMGVITAGYILSQNFAEQDGVEIDGNNVDLSGIGDLELADIEGVYFDLNNGIFFIGNNSPQSSNYFYYDGLELHVNGIINSWNGGDGTLIDGGAIYPGSHIQIGNEDGQSDYCIMDSGNLEFYRYFPDGQHRRVRCVRRIEFGTGEHKENVRIPGYWAVKPIIQVWPKRVPLFAASFQNNSQELICEVKDIDYDPNTGICHFTPYVYATVDESALDDEGEEISPGKIYVNKDFYHLEEEDEDIGWIDSSRHKRETWITDSVSITKGYEKIKIYGGVMCTWTEEEIWGEGNVKEVTKSVEATISAVIDDETEVTLLITSDNEDFEGEVSLEADEGHVVYLKAIMDLTYYSYSNEFSGEFNAYELSLGDVQPGEEGEDGLIEIASGVVTYMAMEIEGEAVGEGDIVCQEYTPPTYLEFNFTDSTYSTPSNGANIEMCIDYK
jgi:predicted phage tail protein